LAKAVNYSSWRRWRQ